MVDANANLTSRGRGFNGGMINLHRFDRLSEVSTVTKKLHFVSDGDAACQRDNTDLGFSEVVRNCADRFLGHKITPI